MKGIYDKTMTTGRKKNQKSKRIYSSNSAISQRQCERKRRTFADSAFNPDVTAHG